MKPRKYSLSQPNMPLDSLKKKRKRKRLKQAPVAQRPNVLFP